MVFFSKRLMLLLTQYALMFVSRFLFQNYTCPTLVYTVITWTYAQFVITSGSSGLCLTSKWWFLQTRCIVVSSSGLYMWMIVFIFLQYLTFVNMFLLILQFEMKVSPFFNACTSYGASCMINRNLKWMYIISMSNTPTFTN